MNATQRVEFVVRCQHSVAVGPIAKRAGIKRLEQVVQVGDSLMQCRPVVESAAVGRLHQPDIACEVVGD